MTPAGNIDMHKELKNHKEFYLCGSYGMNMKCPLDSHVFSPQLVVPLWKVLETFKIRPNYRKWVTKGVP